MREFRGKRKSFGGFGRGGSGRGFSGGFERRERSFEQDAPVKEGEEYDVTISEVGSRGDGIARVKNFVVFVPNTKKGDSVKIKITQLKGRSAVGEVVGKGTATETEEKTEETAEAEEQPAEETEEVEPEDEEAVETEE